MIISNMLKADRRMLSQLSLDEANRYVAGVIAIEREQQGPFASSVQLYITRILTTLFASEEPREAAEVLLAVGLSTVSDLTAPWPGTTQAVEVQRTSANRDVIEHAARCIANVAVNENLSEAIMSEGGLEILDMARGLGPASPQLCRAIANLAKSELCKDRLVSLGWLRQIRNWLMSPDPNMQITGLAALANLASPAMNGLDFVNEIAAQVGLEPLKRLIDEFPKHGPRPASAKQWMLSEMLLRAVANIVVHVRCVLTTDDRNPDRFAEELSKAVAERGVHSEPCCPFWDHRGTDGGHYEALGLTTGLQAAREAARALANMAAHEHLAPTVLALHRSELIELAQLEDLVVREQTARALANLASYRPEGLQEDIRIEAILNSWLQSPESTIKSNAVRALASITFATLSGAKYGEGVHLLYPGLDALTDPEKAKEFSRDHQYDIVFLHGVTGHPFTTWASGNGIEDDEAEGFECWPREWLPEDLPHSGRIISVAFDLYLSGWFGEGEPASHYAVKILRSLKMAAVGSKPLRRADRQRNTTTRRAGPQGPAAVTEYRGRRVLFHAAFGGRARGVVVPASAPPPLPGQPGARRPARRIGTAARAQPPFRHGRLAHLHPLLRRGGHLLRDALQLLPGGG
ncbi:uncharacterized protein ACA1_080530 [Acanthamoeba castellanii str. Neff]|uniref:Protein SERAC1 n=1 Tax=Acanthamoeba castellanii (strain ATCC 30010 / Neff) TaxID=1257118 RepID=L8HD32_ACACF|nr:uncharacterized protein ACA1_080530 [Acanthamoeba castellanii str. Neff]ELR22658.1 hypothetical protein ACA1_080530 [Acanthamoeba castellanii str. Neff]